MAYRLPIVDVQEPLEEFINQPPIQPYMIPRPPSAEQMEFESSMGGVRASYSLSDYYLTFIYFF